MKKYKMIYFKMKSFEREVTYVINISHVNSI